ncbi:unnamed protein product [Brassicogethes aeneus]|uniref:G-protein coupled receptors family 1 profile domain-containing protein n=1 Tax=Brassicogethes aeneus TaxID=1431903 RepID=A0A9P0FJ79_BRAAE|nr:unnamed protein product [Brassicogethes aeneus]
MEQAKEILMDNNNLLKNQIKILEEKVSSSNITKNVNNQSDHFTEVQYINQPSTSNPLYSEILQSNKRKSNEIPQITITKIQDPTNSPICKTPNTSNTPNNLPFKEVTYKKKRIIYIGTSTQTPSTDAFVVKMMIVVVIIFAVCWLPYHLYFIVTSYFPEITNSKYIQETYLAIYWLAMSNSMYNPIIYCWMNAKFRRGFKQCFSYFPFVNLSPDALTRREMLASKRRSYSNSFDRNRIIRNGNQHTNFQTTRMTTSTDTYYMNETDMYAKRHRTTQGDRMLDIRGFRGHDQALQMWTLASATPLPK